MLELGKNLLDRIQIRRIRRKKEELGANCADRRSHCGKFVAAQIVHDHDIAGGQSRDQELLDVGGEDVPIDRTVDHAGSINSVTSQGGKKRHRIPMAERSPGNESAPALRPSSERSHIGFGPSFIEKNQPLGVKLPLMLFPPPACSGDLGALLLFRELCFF